MIGINTAIFSQSGGYMGIGFAIPINMAMSIYRQLRESGRVVRGYMGVVIQGVTPDLARSFGSGDRHDGILVTEVEAGSPAAQAGLQQGDIIVKLDEREVRTTSAFRNAVSMLAPGALANVTVVREGKELTIPVTVGNMDEAVARREPRSLGIAEQVGLAVQPLPPEAARDLGLDSQAGVVVAEVRPMSPAARAGLEPGDVIANVNRKPVTTLAEFDAALAESARTGRVLLLVRSARFARFVVIPLK